ncbi:MAG: hypothetical protein QM703_07710 [Gemmatales bacterium]
MQAMLRIVGVLVVVAGCGTGLYFWFERYQEPMVRTQVVEPLYTVDSSEVAQSLAAGRQVREYGPLPGSAFYPGMPAFQQPEEALVWLKSTGKYEQGWRSLNRAAISPSTRI